MKRLPALIIALGLAIAVIAGTFAALRTTQLASKSTATTAVASTQIARQNHALDRAEAALRAELRRKPPAIKALPQAAPAGGSAQTVIFHRPPPVVHVIHRAGGGEHESEGHDGGGGHDD